MQKVSTGRGGGAANKLPTVLQFLGEAYDSGDKGNLDIINEMAGTSVTVNEAIERSGLVHEGTFIGCHVVQMVAFGNHKEQVGVGAECMWEVDDGMNGITFFMFDCGTLVHSSQTALAYYPPSIVGSNSQLEYGNMESPPVSYLVGSQPIYGESTIVDSTGCFNDFHGSARVSGFLGKSPASMWFNYIWEIYPETQEAGYTVI